MRQAFVYRLYPSRTQERTMEAILTTTRIFYNSLLAERKQAWEERKERVTKVQQLRRVKERKATNPYAASVHSHILQIVADDLDKAFLAFFRRVRTGEKPGYPRFRGANRWTSFGLKELGNGFKIDGRRLKVSGVGRIPVRWHRPIEGDIKTVRISKKAATWYAAFSCVAPDKDPLPATNRSIGIDVGLTHLLTTSDGETVENPRWYRAEQATLRVVQRRIARRKTGGNNRKKAVAQVQRQYERITNRRKDYLNKLVADLVGSHDLIAIEDLRITHMARNRHLAKSILDAGWGYLADHLARKAACAGRWVSMVDPADTSKTCSGCGERLTQEITLAVRWVTCGSCGLSLDRDHNAAINILKRARGASAQQPARTSPLGVNVAGLPACVAQEAVPL
jgi:putative transposase